MFTYVFGLEVNMKKVALVISLLIFGSNVNAESLKTFSFSIPEISASSLLEQYSSTNFTNITEIKRSVGRSVYQSVLPSVVKVLTNEGHGTGIVISSENNGMIITNDHVTSGYKTVGILFASDSVESKISLGTVVQYDEIKDLSLIILNEKRSDLLPIKFPENNIEVGDDVHAIGHPVGEDWTYTRGYVSQKRNEYSWQTSSESHHVANVIQTQTPINPGNSGGPLVNNNGELVGINSFGASDYEGINFSIALSSFYEFLQTGKSVERKVIRSQTYGTLINTIDNNKNGNPDAYFFDTSENSIFDLLALDEDEDLYAETLSFDNNENGVFEISISDLLLDDGSSVLFYEFDDDEDGEVNAVGIDFDRDGNIDKVIPASELQG